MCCSRSRHEVEGGGLLAVTRHKEKGIQQSGDCQRNGHEAESSLIDRVPAVHSLTGSELAVLLSTCFIVPRVEYESDAQQPSKVWQHSLLSDPSFVIGPHVHCTVQACATPCHAATSVSTRSVLLLSTAAQSHKLTRARWHCCRDRYMCRRPVIRASTPYW